MVDRGQVLDLLRRNAVYGDMTGSTQGAGYIGGCMCGNGYIGGARRRRVVRKRASRGGMGVEGGYKGMAKDVFNNINRLKPEYKYNSSRPSTSACSMANKTNPKHYHP